MRYCQAFELAISWLKNLKKIASENTRKVNSYFPNSMIGLSCIFELSHILKAETRLQSSGKMIGSSNLVSMYPLCFFLLWLNVEETATSSTKSWISLLFRSFSRFIRSVRALTRITSKEKASATRVSWKFIILPFFFARFATDVSRSRARC